MKLYMKQKVFSWGDEFHIYNEMGQQVFHVKGEVFSLGKKLHLYDESGAERAFLYQKVWSFLPRYFISQNGKDVAEVVKEFTLLRQEYTVKGLGWKANGDVLAHEYEIGGPQGRVASISKKWFTWGDTYEIWVERDADAVMALCVVLIVDAVLASQAAATVSSGAH